MMASSSSSSPTSKKKTLNFSQIQSTLSKKASSSKTSSLAKRRETVFKKAYELSILCGIEVCVIYYGSDGKLRTWPEDRETVENMARRYIELSETKRRKGSVDLPEFLEKMDAEDSKDKKKKKKKKQRKVRVESNHLKYPDWDPRFDNYSVEQLTELIHALENKQLRLQHRFQGVVEAQKQRTMMQNTNYMNVQEQRMITNVPPMMNHLPQHSNQVPMYHGNGAFSQIPVSAPVFNQSQSLAPIPSSLTIYHNPNSENYPSLLGVQGNGFNGFQNMSTNNDNVDDLSRQTNQNCNVDDYSGGLLGFQETGTKQFENPNLQSYNNINMDANLGFRGLQDNGINGYQNMNMYGYNNNNSNSNGFSQQFAQFPNQRAGPAFQYGSTYTQY